MENVMAWEKETKSVLTREGIKKDILGELRAMMASIVAFVGVMVLFWLIITFIACRGIVGRLISTGVFALLVGVIMASYVRTYLSAARGKICVVEDELLYTAEETVHRGRHLVLERVMYFAEHGRYVVSEVDGSAFDYSNQGDKFYLVIYDFKKSKKNKSASPIRVYNTRLYEWRE
ncbi:MAG: hypothetical protein IJY39_08780 [Clostridia bacterium]|nr:hypothetical protein [Clostridia bacterium]